VTRALATCALAALLFGCGRVSEAQLRDEQSRARRYRDAYESTLAENQQLRKKIEQGTPCAGAPAEPPPSAPASTPQPTH
jgi:hypothetical protein